MTVYKLNVTDYKIGKAENSEDLLCLAALVGSGEIPADSTLENSREYYNSMVGLVQDCGDCPAFKVCLACIQNE